MGALKHSPAYILSKLVIQLKVETVPPVTDPNLKQDWPIYVSSEPNAPDNVVTLYNTQGRSNGRSMLDGEDWHHYGLSVRVRSKDNQVGWAKAEEIQRVLTTQIRRSRVQIEGRLYVIHAVSKLTSPLDIGHDPKQMSRMFIFTMNGLLSIDDRTGL